MTILVGRNSMLDWLKLPYAIESSEIRGFASIQEQRGTVETFAVGSTSLNTNQIQSLVKSSNRGSRWVIQGIGVGVGPGKKRTALTD